MMKNWKTTTLGILAALGEALKHSDNPQLQSWGSVLLQLCIPLGLFFSADSSHPALNAPATRPEDARQTKFPGIVLALTLAALLCFASGCTGGAAMIRAAGKDPSPSTLNIRTIYGSVIYSRGGGSTNTVEISESGALKQNK